MEDVDRLFRRESGRAVASLVRILGDLDLAEEAVQEAFMVALERWPEGGTPDNPGAWITRVARNRAIDRLRRERTLAEKRDVVAGLQAIGAPPDEAEDAESIPDDRLALMFTCCHPALAPEARVALTLRSLAGLTPVEIGRAFLVSESAMARRLSRAKAKIRDARIPYEVPDPDRRRERLPSVLATLYLIFNEGYSATSSDSLMRRELCAEAIRLARILREVMPRESEGDGLLALMLLHHSRRATRVDAAGAMVLLADQERSRWDRAAIEEGLDLVREALAAPPGPYAVQAAIAAEHARAPTAGATDWPRIRRLYDWLAWLDPSPVVMLNRAVAIAMAEGAERGLAAVEEVEGLDSYLHFHSARADLLERVGRGHEAARAYERALELATNAVERSFLTGRCERLRTTKPRGVPRQRAT